MQTRLTYINPLSYNCFRNCVRSDYIIVNNLPEGIKHSVLLLCLRVVQRSTIDNRKIIFDFNSIGFNNGYARYSDEFAKAK